MTKTAKPKFSVGQTVLIAHDDTDPVEEIISRITPGVLYIERRGREYAFDAITGWERADRSPSRLWTTDEWAGQLKRAQVTRALADNGVTYTGDAGFWHDTRTLERVLAVLDGANG